MVNTIEIVLFYAQEDALLCKELAKHLSFLYDQSIDVWYDGLINAGEEREGEIAKHLNSAHIILLLVSPDFLPSHYCSGYIVQQALERHARKEACVIPVILRPVHWQETPFGHLQALPMDGIAVESAHWHSRDAALFTIAEGIRNVIPSLAEQGSKGGGAAYLPHRDNCPYRGLSPYGREDARFFFGREDYLETLFDLLKQDSRFLTLLGPTGSGKTSLVQAGLLPRLFQGVLLGVVFGEVITYAPTSTPLRDLLALPSLHCAQTLKEGVMRWKSYSPHAGRFILVLDPFEALFSPTNDEQPRPFIEQVTELIQSDLATVIIVMQDEYYSDLASQETLIRILEKHLSNIPQLTRKNVADIIQQPAQLIGLGIENGLVDTMVGETMGTLAEPARKRSRRHSSVLPLLSSILEQMVQHQDDFVLTSATYHQLGGIAGCLPNWATNAYHNLLPEHQALARRIFTELVVLGDERSGLIDRKRERLLSQLSLNEQERVAVREVVDYFAKAHLLITTTDENQHDLRVEMIHEILLHEWPLLQDWLREDHQFISWHQMFEGQAQAWQHEAILSPLHTSLLLRGNDLFMALHWLDTRSSKLTSSESLFIQESKIQAEREEKDRQTHEHLEQEQHMAFARGLAIQALLLQEHQLHLIERSILLAIEAMKRYPCIEADKALRQGLQILPRYLKHIQPASHYTLISLSSDGAHLAAVGEEDMIWIQHAFTDTICPRRFPDLRMVRLFALNANGTFMLAVEGRGSTQHIWEVNLPESEQLCYEQQETISTILFRQTEAIIATQSGAIVFWNDVKRAVQQEFYHPGLTCIALSQDESYLYTSGHDKTVRVWDISRGTCVGKIPHANPTRFLALHPHQHQCAIASENSVFLWEWSHKGDRLFQKNHICLLHTFLPKETIQSLTFQKNGDIIIITEEERIFRAWTISSQGGVRCCLQRTSVQAFRIHPREPLLATAEKETVYVWDLRLLEPLLPLSVLPHPDQALSMAFHPSKPYLATSSQNDGLRLWHYGQFSQVTTLPYHGRVQTMDFHAPMLRVVIENPLSFQVWNVTPGSSLPIVFYEETRQNGKSAFLTNGYIAVKDQVRATAFSPSRRYVATAYDDGAIILYEIEGDQVYERARRKEGGEITALAFTPNEDFLGFADQDQTLAFWNWQERLVDSVVRWHSAELVEFMVFSNDQQSLVTISRMHTITVWNYRKQECWWRLPQEGSIGSFALSRDGSSFLIVNADQLVHVGDLSKRTFTSSLKHDGDVKMAVFSPQGRYIATASSDHTSRVWDARTGRPLAELVHDGEVYALTFSDDEIYLATASEDQYIRIWSWHPEWLLQEAAYHMTRNFTHEEWKQYFGEKPYQKTLLLNWRGENHRGDL